MKALGDFGIFRVMVLLACMGTCFCFVNSASAGVNLPFEQSYGVEAQAAQDSTQQSSSGHSTQTKAEEKSETNEEPESEADQEKKKDKGKKSPIMQDHSSPLHCPL